MVGSRRYKRVRRTARELKIDRLESSSGGIVLPQHGTQRRGQARAHLQIGDLDRAFASHDAVACAGDGRKRFIGVAHRTVDLDQRDTVGAPVQCTRQQ